MEKAIKFFTILCLVFYFAPFIRLWFKYFLIYPYGVSAISAMICLLIVMILCLIDVKNQHREK